jgi:hypothetical protein
MAAGEIHLDTGQEKIERQGTRAAQASGKFQRVPQEGWKMKSLRVALPLFLILTTSTLLAQSDAQKSFATLRSLAGSWEGKASNGKVIQVSYKVTSNGSAVMSEIFGEEDMITMFHLDGDRLLLTHYCGAGNQPRMQAMASPDGKTITFDFVDATNLASSQPGHMHRVVITLLDANHRTEDWLFKTQDGKEMHERFDLERKKPV